MAETTVEYLIRSRNSTVHRQETPGHVGILAPAHQRTGHTVLLRGGEFILMDSSDRGELTALERARGIFAVVRSELMRHSSRLRRALEERGNLSDLVAILRALGALPILLTDLSTVLESGNPEIVTLSRNEPITTCRTPRAYASLPSHAQHEGTSTPDPATC